MLSTTNVSSVNVGTFCFGFIDDKIPYLQATRSDPLYVVHGLDGIVDEVNVIYDISASTLGNCGKLFLRSRRAAS